MRIVIFVCLSALLLLAGYWVFSAAMIERQTTAVLANTPQLQGRAESVTGFPLAFRTAIDAPSWHSQDSQRGWQADSLALSAPSYRPNDIAVMFPPVQQLRLGTAESRLTTEEMTAQLVVTRDLELRTAALDLRAATLTPPLAVATLAAGQIDLQWIADNRYSLQARAEALRLPPEILTLFSDDSPGDAALVEELAATATARFAQPLPLQGPWPYPDALEITEARLAWGALQLTATGEIARSPAGLLEGSLRLSVEDWHPLLALLQQHAILPPDAAQMAGMFLATQAEPGTNRVTLPLELRDATLWLGPIALLHLPAL